MEIEIPNIINSHRGKIGLCVATGSSLKPHLDKVISSSKKKKDFCTFSVNEFDDMIDLDADFRIVANNEFTVAREHKRLNNSSSLLCYADSVDLTSKPLVETLLNNVHYLPYDQRHFGGKTCKELGYSLKDRLCCFHIKNDRLTIQEELAKYTGGPLYGQGSTVALHMAAFAILCGCRKIFVFGVDLDYRKGYVNPRFMNPTSFNPYISEIVDDFGKIRECAEKKGVGVFSACAGSPINQVLEYVDSPEL